MNTSATNFQSKQASFVGLSPAKRAAYLPIAIQIMLDSFCRLKLQMGALIWVSFIIPISALASHYYGTRNKDITVADSIQDLDPFITHITFYLAAIISFWGLWTRESSSSFPGRYFLLPVSTTFIFLTTLGCQVLLCLTAVMAGLALPILIGFDFHLLISLPLYSVAVIVALHINWCRTEYRFVGYVFTVTALITFLVWRTEFFIYSLNSTEYLNYPNFASLLIITAIGICLVGRMVIGSQRKGRFYGITYLASLIAEKSKTQFQAVHEPTAGPRFFWFDNWGSKLAMLTAYDLRRIFVAVAVIVLLVNLFAFILMTTLQIGSGEMAAICLFVSFAIILIGCFMHSVRSRLADNEIRSHLSVLPIDDKKLGLTWLVNLWMTYFFSLIVFFFSLAPLFAYMLHEKGERFLPIFLPPIQFITTPILIISLINGLMTAGRTTYIVRTLLVIALLVILSAFAALQQWHFLLYGLAMFFSVAMYILYIVIVIGSFRNGLFVWWTNLFMVMLVALQLYLGYDLMFGTPIYDNYLFGLTLLPALPFVFAPLGTYLNRHR